MRAQMLRRRGLGRGSCNGISDYMSNVLGRDILVVRNDQPTDWNEVDLLIRWGCTSTIFPHTKLELNSSKHIHLVNNKQGTRVLCEDLAPPTIFAKYAFENYDFTDGSMWIGRPKTHSQGKNAVFCRSREDLENDTTSEYWSLYLPKEKEYRVYCFMGRVLCVAEKVPTDREAVLWNRAQGGSSFVNVRWSDWPIDCIRTALIAQERTGIDFTGVDVMVFDDQPFLLELNSAPTLSSKYRQECFAKAFDWVLSSLEEGSSLEELWFNIGEYVTNWKGAIHPAIWRG